MAKFKTLQFPNTPKGQKQKVEALANESAQGWRVVGETIEQGKFKGGDACCLFMICAPLAFLAGHTEGTITVTLQRDASDQPASEEKTQSGPRSTRLDEYTQRYREEMKKRGKHFSSSPPAPASPASRLQSWWRRANPGRRKPPS